METVFTRTNNKQQEMRPVWVYFGCQNRVMTARFSTLHATVVHDPEKDVKIHLKHFSIVQIAKR